MSKHWPTVRLGEVLEPIARPEAVQPTSRYRMLGTRWYAGGLFAKEERTGQEIAAAKLYRVCEGDFVYNRLFAWKGSFAIAGKESDGCYVSNEFPCFGIRRERLDPSFLGYYFHRQSAWFEALGLSSGATPTSRNRLKESLFLKMKIPLPPLAEQRRVVARIEELAAQIHEARSLRGQAVEEAESLLRSILTHDKQAKPAPMRELVKLRSPDVTVQADETYQFAGVYCFGRGVFKGLRKSGMDFAYARLTRLRAGEFVYPKLMAWEGALGVVPPDCEGCVVSTEFPVFEVNEDRVFHEVLDTHFRTPSVWPKLSRESTGTNVRRRRLNPQDFLDYEIPLPSRHTQMTLRVAKAEVDALKRLQAESAVELDALLPAILDRAFRGEL
ncbi:MAG: restriction endonuclease subunit S [Pirellulaceae bacterium]